MVGVAIADELLVKMSANLAAGCGVVCVLAVREGLFRENLREVVLFFFGLGGRRGRGGRRVGGGGTVGINRTQEQSKEVIVRGRCK